MTDEDKIHGGGELIGGGKNVGRNVHKGSGGSVGEGADGRNATRDRVR